MFAEPSKLAEPVMSPVRVNDLALASLVAVAALPTIEAVMAPASKLPSASRLTSVFAVLLSVSSGRSYFSEFHGVTPSPIFRREVSSSIPSSPCARIGLTFAHCCAPSRRSCSLFAIVYIE